MNETNESREAGGTSDFIRMVADWLDREQMNGLWGGPGGSSEIQDGLRESADELDALVTEYRRMALRLEDNKQKNPALVTDAYAFLQEVADMPVIDGGEVVYVELPLDRWEEMKRIYG